jgi:hypothetical protein
MPRSPSLLLPLLLLFFSFVATVDPSCAQQAVPHGYQLLTDQQFSGGLLISQRQGVTTATPLLVKGFGEIATFFDGRPTALGGFRDAYHDQRAEAGFQGTIRGAPISGVGFATVVGGTGTVGFAFDSPHTIPQTLPRLLQLAGSRDGSSPGSCPPSPSRWRIARYPDESGQIQLPEGWRITGAQKGQVFAEGPHGLLNRGFNTVVITRAGAAQAAAIGPPFPVADPTDPVTPLLAVWARISTLNQQQSLPPFRVTRVIEVAPQPVSRGFSHVALIDLEFDRGGVMHRGVSHVFLGTIMSGGTYLYYESNVSSRAECFAQNLSTLVQIWDSAQTAGHVVQERLEHTMRSLRQASDIWWQATRNREQAQQRTHDNWTEAFRGTRVIEDTRTGTRADAPLSYSADIVQRLNQQEGEGRYREIPLRDLNLNR